MSLIFAKPLSAVSNGSCKSFADAAIIASGTFILFFLFKSITKSVSACECFILKQVPSISLIIVSSLFKIPFLLSNSISVM